MEDGLKWSRMDRRIEEVVSQVYRAGEIVLPGREPHRLIHNINAAEGRVLRDWVARVKPRRTLEVGMATGLSGLHICWGLARAHAAGGAEASEAVTLDDCRHLAIDPFQATYWQSIGLALRDYAGCEDIFTWTGERDDQALPRLWSQGEKFDLALIDGDHRFEAALLDFYYIDKMLATGGICVFDDTDWPSVWRVVQFAIRHRRYEWVDAVPIDQGPLTRPWGWMLRIRRWKTFKRQNWPLREALFRKPYSFVVLRKTTEEQRPEHFWASLE